MTRATVLVLGASLCMACVRDGGSARSPDGRFIIDVHISDGPATTRDSTLIKVRHSTDDAGSAVPLANMADAHRIEDLRPEWTKTAPPTVQVYGNCDEFDVNPEGSKLGVRIQCVSDGKDRGR